MVEYGHKPEEKLKAMQSEIKGNVQGTNSEETETGTQINGLEQKEETFSQTGGRGRDGQLGRRGLLARQRLEDRAVPRLRMDKLGETTGE